MGKFSLPVNRFVKFGIPPELAQAAAAKGENLLALLSKAPMSPLILFVMPMAVCANAKLLIAPDARDVEVNDDPVLNSEVSPVPMPKRLNAFNGCNPAGVKICPWLKDTDAVGTLLITPAFTRASKESCMS